jgi:hypothetical protein
LCVAQQGLGTWQRIAALQTRNSGLAGPHAGSQLGLGQTGAQSGSQQLCGYLELRPERVVFGFTLGLASKRAFSFSRIVIGFLYLNFEIDKSE